MAIGEFKLELQSGNDFSARVKNWRLTLKTIEHLSHASSSFVHHFVAIYEF